MKQNTVLSNRFVLNLAMLLCSVSSMGQRDFELSLLRNPWLTSVNSASLVSFADSTVSCAAVGCNYHADDYRQFTDGGRAVSLQADVRSLLRLSDNIMTYGSATYQNTSASNASGPMILGQEGWLHPFNLLQPAEDSGRKHLERISLSGAVGCNIVRDFSVGVGVDFGCGNWAKYKDLRHANTLMQLKTEVSAFYTHGEFALGGSLLYGRSTEGIRFKTYGTTNHVYTVLLEYANSMGETLTYGGDGFIDSNTELPLFNKYLGASVQGSWSDRLHLSLTALRRSGFYGQQSQYTVSHANHHGSMYAYCLRYTLPSSRSLLHWVDVSLHSEHLSAYKTNYRQVHSAENPSVVCYEYYQPTKISDKLSDRYSLCYTAFLQPSGAIYKWHFSLNADCLYGKQTAYLYPQTHTRRQNLYALSLSARRNIIMLRNSTFFVQGSVGRGYAKTLDIDFSIGTDF